VQTDERRGADRPRRPRYLPRRGAAREARRARYLPRRDGPGAGRRARYLPPRGGRRRGGGGIGILVVVLLLVGAGLLIWFLVSRGDGDGSTAGEGSVAEGTIQTGDGQDVLAAAGGGAGALAPFEDQTVRAQGVDVQSVVGEDAFWAGSDPARRVFVVVSGVGDSVPDIAAGDRVDLSGIVRVLPVDFEQRFGVDAADGSADLQAQGHYIEALSVTEPGS
jgi:hypothetical protein